MSMAMRVVHLPERITIEKAAAIREQLLETIEASDSVLLHLDAVTHADAAGVQLLYAALRLGDATSTRIEFAGTVQDGLEIALLSGGFCREVPREGKDLRTQLAGLHGGAYAG